MYGVLTGHSGCENIIHIGGAVDLHIAAEGIGYIYIQLKVCIYIVGYGAGRQLDLLTNLSGSGYLAIKLDHRRLIVNDRDRLRPGTGTTGGILRRIRQRIGAVAVQL